MINGGLEMVKPRSFWFFFSFMRTLCKYNHKGAPMNKIREQKQEFTFINRLFCNVGLKSLDMHEATDKKKKKKRRGRKNA